MPDGPAPGSQPGSGPPGGGLTGGGSAGDDPSGGGPAGAARIGAGPRGRGAPVVAVVRFDVPPEAAGGFPAAGERVVAALAACAGFRAARLARAVDEPSAWLLVSEWDGPGAWRRALSAFDVRCELTPLLAYAVDAPGAFEVLREQEAGSAGRSYGSGLAPDADTASPGGVPAPARDP